jgi:hypothetical protein
MCFQAALMLEDDDDTRQAKTFSRTFLRNIVFGELYNLIKGVDMQLTVSEKWFKTRHTNRQVGLDGVKVICADKSAVRWWRCLVLEEESEVQGSCAVYTYICKCTTQLPLH